MSNPRLEMIGWDITDDPANFVKSIKPIKGVKYVICEVVIPEEVMRDDLGKSVTNADILKAARNVDAADSLRKRVRSRGLRAFLDNQIVKSQDVHRSQISKKLDPRDGDGDGKIFDGTPQEQAAAGTSSQPETGASRPSLMDRLKLRGASVGKPTEDAAPKASGEKPSANAGAMSAKRTQEVLDKAKAIEFTDGVIDSNDFNAKRVIASFSPEEKAKFESIPEVKAAMAIPDQFDREFELEMVSEKHLKDIWSSRPKGAVQDDGEIMNKWGKSSEGGAIFKFATDTGNYTINANKIDEGYVNVDFVDQDGSFNMTGAGLKTAHQVFSNVTVAMAALVNKASPKCMSFSAVGDSRQRLYDRLVRTISSVSPDYEAFAIHDGTMKKYFVAKKEEADAVIKSFMSASYEKITKALSSILKSNSRRAYRLPQATPEQMDKWSNQEWTEEDMRDGDGDGKVYDGTDKERPVRDNVGRKVDAQAASQTPEAAASALRNTTRPEERVRLVEKLRQAGMSESQIADAREKADSSDETRPNSQPSEPTKADAGGRVLFEAAPDPNDKELADQWRGLKNEVRVAISREVVNSVMPQVAEKLGVKLSIHEQLGGYLDDTNPSFAATFNGEVDPAKFIETMKAAGFAMSQDSMMGISKDPLEGAEKAGFITVDIPQGADVHETYMKIRSMDPSVQGHTTIGNQMTIVDFTGRHEEIADAISTKLGLNAYDEVGYAAFVDKKDYGYGQQNGQSSGQNSTGGTGQSSGKDSTGDAGQAGQGVSDVDGKQRWGDDLRSKASGVIRDRINSAKSKSGGQPEPEPAKGIELSNASSQPGSDGQVGFQTDGQPDESGNVNLKSGLKVPRNELPQIVSADTEEFKQWLQSKGIGVSSEPVDPRTLKPIQAQVNQKKIDEMSVASKDGVADITSKPVMVSSDGYLIDGHHRAVVAANSGKQMTGTKIDMPAKELLEKMKEFPKVFYEGMEANRGIKNYTRFAPSTASKFKVANPEGRNSWNRYAQNPGNEGDPSFHDDRKQMHESIRKSIVDVVQPVAEGEQPIAIMFGGGPASGKSSLLESGDIVLPGQIVKVDSDHIKSMLPDYDELIKDPDQSLSQRAASFVHEESSFVSKQVLGSALGTRRHTLLDGTGNGSLESIERKSRQMRAAGHKVVAQYVTVDTDEALRRSNARAAKTGRFVPESVIRGTHEKVSAVMPQAISEGLFDEWNLWDTGMGGKPVQVASGKGSSGVIHDRSAWHRFLKKAGEQTFGQFKDLFPESAPSSPVEQA